MSGYPDDPSKKGEQQMFPPPPAESGAGAPPTDYGAPYPNSAGDQSARPVSGSLPAYSEHDRVEPPAEKPAATSAQPGQGASSDQFIPPPPPGPPPAQSGHGQFDGSSDMKTGDASQYNRDDDYNEAPPPLPGPRPGQSASTHSNIPDYNPADSQYAPPPGQHPPPAGGHNQNATEDPLAYGEAQQQAPQSEKSRFSAMLSSMGHKAAAPINAFANKLGSQSFLPTTMDKECDKAAHILKSFCKEGITSDADAVKADDHVRDEKPSDAAGSEAKDKQRKPHGHAAIVKIPSKVINKAVGLAIFTTARAGYGFSGATGSGVLIARRPDGSWSPPSGIQVHAVGAGFMIGVDIYDCVCVINSRDALGAFMSTRVSLGPDVAVSAGPYGAGGLVDIGGGFRSHDERKAAEAQKAQLEQQRKEEEEKEKLAKEDGKLRPGKGHTRRSSSMSMKPVFTYVKSRGFYAGVQVDGTVITERKDANAAFYGHQVGVEQILRGDVPGQGPMWPAGARSLYEALRVAEAQQPLPDANIAPPPKADANAATQASAPEASYGQAHAGGYGAPVPGGPTHMSGGQGPHDEELPGYHDDGVQRPGVGDEKVRYE